MTSASKPTTSPRTPFLVLAVFALFVAACSGGDSEPSAEEASGDGSTDSESGESGEASSTSTAAPSTTSSTTTSTTTTSSTTTTTTTTEPADTEAPSAPTGVVCDTGGGSGEITLSWDEPPAEEGVTTVRVYQKEEGGSFERIHRFDVPDELLPPDGARWRADALIASDGLVQMAVTHGDAAGNESGWHPIDVAYFPYPTGPCWPIPMPTVLAAVRGAGSLEVDLTVEAQSPVADWSVTVDQGSGFVPLTVLGLQDGAAAYEKIITVMTVDWTLPATYRVVAVDSLGYSSAPGERVCGPISPGDIAC